MTESEKRLTDQVLVDAVDHIHYEIDMLRETAIALSKLGEKPWVVKNSLVESFVIHARGLVEFLYGTPRYKDDVSAQDYFDEGE